MSLEFYCIYKEYIQQDFIYADFWTCCLIPIKEYIQQVEDVDKSEFIELFNTYKRVYTTRFLKIDIQAVLLFNTYKRVYTTSLVLGYNQVVPLFNTYKRVYTTSNNYKHSFID